MSTTSQDRARAEAERFHEAYERLAPSFGYATREDTRAFDPESANGKLMIAVCSEMLAREQSAQPFEFDSAGLMEGSVDAWKEYGYDKSERVDERFRGNLLRVWKVAWIESRARLIGRTPASSPVPAQPSSAIVEAAQAVINRWDSPRWEWNKHGNAGNLIADLRAAITNGGA
jgi:hypothetical protein